MIKATVEQVRDAYKAFRRINEEVRLPQKPAWRISRLLGQLKTVVVEFEETQMKLFVDAGGQQGDGGIVLASPEREDDMDSSEWKTVIDAHREKINKLNDDIRALNREEVQINYDPIPLKLFDDDDNTPANKRRHFSANDFADAGPFLEDEKKE